MYHYRIYLLHSYRELITFISSVVVKVICMIKPVIQCYKVKLKISIKGNTFNTAPITYPFNF